MRNSTTPSVPQKGEAILSGAQIFAVLILAIALAYLLIPKDSELVERLVEDGRHARATELVASPAPTGAPTGADEPESNHAEGLIEVLLTTDTGNIDDKRAEHIASLIAIAEDPHAVHLRLQPERDRLTTAGELACLDALATRAVQTGEPAFATDLYRERWQIEAPDTDLLPDIVAAYRYSGNPKGALDAITRFLGDHGQPFSRLPKELRMTTVALHREINEGSKAFDLLSEEYAHSIDAETRQQLIDLMTVTAVQSDRIVDCLPMVESYVASLSPPEQNWRDLLNAPVARDSSDFLKYGSILAHHREWSSNNEGAFGLYLKLAALGDLEALDRCVEIYPWIDAQDRATALLEAMAPIAERPQYTLLTARLEADSGELDRAIELLQPLALSEQKANLWLEYAQMLDENGRQDQAILAFRKAADVDPENLTPLTFSARLLIARGRVDEALADLSRLPASAHDHKSLEDFVMLASSLGDSQAEQQALELRVEHNAQLPVASAFADLSDFYQRKSDFEQAVRVVREGLEALPDNQSLQLLLADRLVESGQPDAAFETLRNVRKPEDPRFAVRLLDVGDRVSDPQLALKTLLLTKANAELSPAQRLDFASLYELNGDLHGALELYRQVHAGAGDVARIEAEIAFGLGDVSRALELQHHYLKQTAEPDYEGWMFFGDLQQASGNASAARGAYQHALEILRGRVGGESGPKASALDNTPLVTPSPASDPRNDDREPPASQATPPRSRYYDLFQSSAG